MTKLLSFLICLLACIDLQARAAGEPLAFRAPATVDHAALVKAMAELAREALAEQPHSNADQYTRYLLQLAAGQYGAAVVTFGKWRKQHPARSGLDPSILLELYSKAKALEATEHIPYEQAFKLAFAALVGPLDDGTALDDEYLLQTPILVFRGQFDRSLAHLKDQNAIAFSDALGLIRVYLATTALQSFAPYLDGATAADDEHRYLIQEDVLIRTAEGATLSAIVVRCKGVAVRQPTSLFFNIYTDLDGDLYQAKLAAVHGYVGVAADARGKRLSHDKIEPWEHEVQDTFGVIDWISKQPWSDGQVGMYGS
ncbi:MAG: CocE/NonD family hydrolase, partial [Mycobacteriales bacterium]